MNPAFWADVIVAVHLGYVSFVVIGQLLILAGLIFRWQWVRNPWFRSIHLIAIAIVATEAFFDVKCPLTTWERNLREKAGQEVSEASFVGRMANDILFYRLDVNQEEMFRYGHMAFGGLVILTFVLAPPRFRRKAAAPAPGPGQPAPAG
jgi:Protein of Unknown function (DUF2784)